MRTEFIRVAKKVVCAPTNWSLWTGAFLLTTVAFTNLNSTAHAYEQCWGPYADANDAQGVCNYYVGIGYIVNSYLLVDSYAGVINYYCCGTPLISAQPEESELSSSEPSAEEQTE